MFDEVRLERLINAYFDRTLVPDEKGELEQMLLTSARARRMFHEHAKWHGIAREWALRGQVESFPKRATAPSPPQASEARGRRIVPFPFSRRAAFGWVAAAAIALAWLVTRVVVPPVEPAPANVVVEEVETIERIEGPCEVAMLADAVDVEWSDGSPRPGVGAALPPGRLAFERGILRMDFYSGVHVVLEGPASIELLSQDEARLERGKLTARVTPPAIGFTVHNDAVKVVDRGTEFGMNVTGPGRCEVHVFDGEVALLGGVLKTGEKLLFGGDGIAISDGRWSPIPSDRGSFVDPVALRDAIARLTRQQWERWRSFSHRFRSSKDLKVYFDFQGMDPSAQSVTNRAAGEGAIAGTVIGCEPCPGRWPDKTSIGFAKTSDRVRFRMEGSSSSLTLMAWVRVDSLPQDHNALLSMSPGRKGEIHWKLDSRGCLLVGIRAVEALGKGNWERLASPPIVGPNEFGHWMHLATVVDGETGMVRHYANGREVASGPLARPAEIQFGTADLGNYGSRTIEAEVVNTTGIIRNFSGRIDEFALFARALSPEEIAAAASAE